MEPEARGAPALVLTQQQQPWPWPEPAEREVGSRGQHPPTVTSLRGAWLVPAFTPRGCCFLGCPVLRKEGREPPGVGFSCGSKRLTGGCLPLGGRHITRGLVKSAWDAPGATLRLGRGTSHRLPDHQAFASMLLLPATSMGPRAVLPRDRGRADTQNKQDPVKSESPAVAGSREPRAGGSSFRAQDPRRQSAHLASGAAACPGVQGNTGGGNPPQNPGGHLQQLPESLGCLAEEGFIGPRSGHRQASWQCVVLPPGHTGPGP